MTVKFGLAKVKDIMKDTVNSSYEGEVEKQKAESYIVLKRGVATIPLADLGVTFRSRYLWPGVIIPGM